MIERPCAAPDQRHENVPARKVYIVGIDQRWPRQRLMVQYEKPEDALDEDYEQATSDFVNVGKSAILLLSATLEATYIDENDRQRRAWGNVELAHIESASRSEMHVQVFVQRDLGIQTMRWTGVARFGQATFSFFPSPKLNLSRPEVTLNNVFAANPVNMPNLPTLWRDVRAAHWEGKRAAARRFASACIAAANNKANASWRAIRNSGWRRYATRTAKGIAAIVLFGAALRLGLVQGTADAKNAKSEATSVKAAADAASRAAGAARDYSRAAQASSVQVRQCVTNLQHHQYRC